jgi:hypothetical protein
MNPKAQFFFYLAACICFVLATIGDAWRYGARTRRGAASALALTPLGLALAVFPTLWTAATIGW